MKFQKIAEFNWFVRRNARLIEEKWHNKHRFSILFTEDFSAYKNLPCVSVIVPNVDYDHYLFNAVNNIRHSSLKNIQIIILNSGTYDVAVANSLMKLDDSRLVIVNMPLQKLGRNRNDGISLADAPVICSFDPDDLMHRQFLEITFFRLFFFRLDVSGAGMQSFGNENERWNVPKIVTSTMLNFRNCLASNSLFRKEIWRESGGFKDSEIGTHIHEDWRFWHRVSKLGASIESTNRPLTSIRIHGSNMSRQTGLLKVKDQAKHIRRFNADINYNFVILIKKLKLSFLRFHLSEKSMPLFSEWVARNENTILISGSDIIKMWHFACDLRLHFDEHILIINDSKELILESINDDIEIFNLYSLVVESEVDFLRNYLVATRNVIYEYFLD